MLCTSPLRAYAPDLKTRNLIFCAAGSSVVLPPDCRPFFNYYAIPAHLRDSYKEVFLPCGKCIACRISRSRDWVVRNCLELMDHSSSAFITLTYDQEHFPSGGSLSSDDLSNFMKRLRYEVDKSYGVKIRFFGCGEYGSNLHRPHYHLIIYGFDFPDRYYWSGDLYRSPLLEKVWENGFSTVGNVSSDSIRYVCGYVMKKHYGAGSDDYYGDMMPEFVRMSLKPGIGFHWFEKYGRDICRFNDHEILQFGVPSVDQDGLTVPPVAFKRRLADYFPDVDFARRKILEDSVIPSPDWQVLRNRRELLNIVDYRAKHGTSKEFNHE